MSEELKPCPWCSGEVRAHKSKNPPLHRPSRNGWNVECNECDLLFGYDIDYAGVYDTEADAITAWNRRAEPDMGITATDHIVDTNKKVKPIEIEAIKNAPLTLDELRGMDGEPVWCVACDDDNAWALVHAADEACTDADDGDWEFYCYGWKDGGKLNESGWLAYRRNP